MSNQKPPNDASNPILGFATGTPLLTPEGHKSIEQLRPGDLIQTQPDNQGDDVYNGDLDHDPDPRWWERN